MMAVTAGSSCSSHSAQRDVGSGSSEQVVFLTRVQRSAGKIRCTGQLLARLAAAFNCLVPRGLFSPWVNADPNYACYKAQ